MISNPCIEVQTTSENRFSVPAWFAEVVIMARYLEKKGLLEAFAHQVRLVRGRFGTYEPIDFLALLIGSAISGERTLADFFERLEPFETAFMALFGRNGLPHRSSLSRWSSRCGSSVFRSVPHALPAAYLRAMPGPRKPLAVSSTERRAATLSLTSMRRVKQHGNARCPAIPPCLQHDADWMPSVRLATEDASVVRWSARAPRRCKCTRANGSARMQARAMAIIAVNWPAHSEPSRPI
jgi:hypothetical protein